MLLTPSQYRLRPSVLQGLLRIFQPRMAVVQFVKQYKACAPGYLCNDPLHNCLLSPDDGKGTHVLEVAEYLRGFPTALTVSFWDLGICYFACS